MSELSDNTPAIDPLLPLLEDFIARLQQGDSVSVEEYCTRHPELADEIRDLFPTYAVLEELGPAQDTSGQEADDKPLPSQIGDYLIVAEIGRGGMGVVYEAEQQSLGRRVALKVLPSNLYASSNSRIRFQREARAAAKLHHTNIVPVFEVGEEEGVVYYAMQLIPGQSLDLVIEQLKRVGPDATNHQLNQPVSNAGAASSGSQGSSVFGEKLDESLSAHQKKFYRSVAKIGIQVADALAFAHQRGVIHRDIKPSNLLLDGDGVAWVADFGLAKMDDEGLTQTGEFLGTLRYMSPERFEGKCDVRADIYSLGLTLYELALQRTAFESADRLKLVQLISHTQPVRPRSIDPRVPRDLETIILKSIDKDLRRRYKSSRLLEQDLQRFLNDEPILARRSTLVEQMVRWTRRNRALAASLCSILMLLSVLLVGAAWTAVHQTKLRQESELARAHAEQSLYVTQMNLAGQVVDRATGAAEIQSITAAWLPANTNVDRRDWEWYYLRSHCNESILTLQTKQRRTPLDAVWSPDQTRIATAQSDGHIYLWEARSGRELQRIGKHPNIVVTLAWHPHEPLLAACDDNNNIWIWDLTTAKTIKRFQAPRGTLVEQVAWDAGGNWLAWSSNSSVYLWDRSSKQSDPIELIGGPKVITALQWSPDGKQLAAASWRQQQTTIWDVSQQRIVRSDLQATLIEWGQDHQLRGWLLATDSGEILHFRAGKDGPPKRFTGHTKMARFLSWSSDRQRFISAADDNTLRVWDTEAGTYVRVFQGHSKAALTARFSPDDQRIVSTSRDGTAKIWDADSKQRRTLQTPAALDKSGSLQDRPPTCSLSWHPTNDQLAVVSADSRLRVWDVSTGEMIFTDPQRWVEQAYWSPDGRMLAADELEGASLAHYPGDAYMVNAPGTAYLYMEFQNGAARVMDIPHPMRCNAVAWAPGGNQLATVANDMALRLWSIAKAQTQPQSFSPRHILGSHAAEQVAWHPHQVSLIATSNRHGEVELWQENALFKKLSGHRQRIHRLAWSPNGDRLASASEDGTVRVWNHATGETTHVLKGHHNTVFDVAWRPGGQRLATAGADGTVKIWDSTTGNELLTVWGHQSAVMGVTWSPDGYQLATADLAGNVFIWDATAAYLEEIPASPR